MQVLSQDAPTPSQASPTLADLSRNASVISSSSDSSSVSDLTIQIPARPRQNRTFSSPRRPLRSQSPNTPTTPRGSRPPPYLGIEEDPDDHPSGLRAPEIRPTASRTHSGSRNSSVNGRGVSVNDFKFGKTLGQGSYSTVMYARSNISGEEYAIKVIDKAHLKRKDKMHIAQAERNTLVRLGSGHPGIVRLHSTFQDNWSLYFVLDLARNGELQSKISKLGSLSLPAARYFAAQIIDTLQYMHSQGVLHRDLKPENVLLDDNFRVKICDFGTGKIVDESGKSSTFVGTPQYVSPELLERNETTRSSDFWALGCIIFQMISGKFAFHGLSDYLTLEKIKKLDYSFPEGFDKVAKDLVEKLLLRDPVQRLGAGSSNSPNDIQALRSHPFFASINWSTLWADPAPPLEAGLVKKEPPPPHPNGGKHGDPWSEVVQNWDDDDDDISWASDTEGNLAAYQLNGNSQPGSVPLPSLEGINGAHDEPVGPLGETRSSAFLKSAPPIHHTPSQDSHSPSATESNATATPSPDQAVTREVVIQAPDPVVPTSLANGGAHTKPGLLNRVQKPETQTELDEVRDIVPSTLDALPPAVKTQALQTNDLLSSGRKSSSIGSMSSSSEGSPTERVNSNKILEMELERGRNRAQTPIQGSWPDEWRGMLHQGESVLYTGTVETSPLRRRASRIFAIAVAPKRKPRELLLTNRRLMCLKRKPNRPFVIRYEWPLGRSTTAMTEKEREKETRYQVVGVGEKAEKEFTIMTATKSHTFHTSSSILTSVWVRKIREALDAQAQLQAAAQQARVSSITQSSVAAQPEQTRTPTKQRNHQRTPTGSSAKSAKR